MRGLGLVLVGLALWTGCSHAMRDQAVASCRASGYLGAIENNGAWYCFKGPALIFSEPK